LKKDSGIQESLADNLFFEKVFREYFVALSYYALKLVNDHDTAKDIVHQVFINIWEKRDNISMDRPVRSYLYTSVHNRCLNFIRDRERFVEYEAGETDLSSVAVTENSDSMEKAETEARIAHAIASLPERCGDVFRLSRFENKKYAEIAVIMNISVKTVEAQMSRALRILKNELKDLLIILVLLFISGL